MPSRIDRFLLCACAATAPLIGAPVAFSQANADPPPYLGEPFTIGQKPYHPADTGPTDEIGYAGVVPASREGARTAIGEAFVSRAISGAHKTLPLPGYVEVTALATGRTILLRVNDRGPMVNDRLIDISCGAARQLGLEGDRPAAVRVRRVSPPEPERGALRQANSVAERLPTPEPLLVVLRKRLPTAPGDGMGPAQACGAGASVAQPANTPRDVAVAPRKAAAPVRTLEARPTSPAPEQAPTRAPAPAPDRDFIIEQGDGGRPVPVRATPKASAQPAGALATGVYAVQVAALADGKAAAALARRIGGHVENAGRLCRVRLGPYADRASASAALVRIRARGYPGARLVINGR